MTSSMQSSSAAVHYLDHHRQTKFPTSPPPPPPPTAAAAPPATPTPDDGQSRRQHASRVFAFNRQVRADPDLAASFKVVAACIVETFMDHRTGVAIVGTDKIAKSCGCSPATVKAAVKVLAITYFDVEWGSQGVGHANRYRMKRQPVAVSNSQPADVSAKAKRVKSRAQKGQNTATKGQPADMNYYTTLSTEQSGATAPLSVPVSDSEGCNEEDRAFGALCRYYNTTDVAGCKEVFLQILANGVADDECIMDHACDYIARCEDAGHIPKPMIEFLNSKLEEFR